MFINISIIAMAIFLPSKLIRFNFNKTASFLILESPKLKTDNLITDLGGRRGKETNKTLVSGIALELGTF